MLFNSVHFLLFFPIVILLFFVLPNTIRKYWLLVASYYFYMCWNANYVFLIAFITLISYVSGLTIEIAKTQKAKKVIMIFPVAISMIVLIVYKYSNFIVDCINSLFQPGNDNIEIGHFDIILPVGISFYTFQAIGYVIDVYRGERAEKNICDYALFISFFPQLVAGPIERSKNILSQIHEVKNSKFNFENVYNGLLLMGWGLFQKIVVSDRVSVVVDTIFDHYEEYGLIPICFATILFAFQIYCDFDGYTNIARGAAKVINIDIIHNFRQPYMATTVCDFWNRWHISLTGWFRDYLYIPLGGNRKGRTRQYINIMIVFFLSGFWHGAGWNFVFWGTIHGFAQIISHIRLKNKETDKEISLSTRFRKMIGTFLVVDFAWFFFRVPNMKVAWLVIQQMFTRLGDFEMITSCLNSSNWRLLWSGIVLIILVDLLHEKAISIRDTLIRQEIWLRYAVYIGIIVACIYFGVNNGDDIVHQFIYFQF